MANLPLVSDAREFFSSCRPLVDSELEKLIPKESEEPVRVHAAIRWSVFAGGKRFRPALLLAAGQTFHAHVDKLLRTACALEMIHTYSLIHDDLPPMDNDDLRRGRPTCHIKFDEATAILAGDALQALAFQTIAEDQLLSPSLRVELIAEVSRAAGTPFGMVAGQAHDLDAESRDVGAAELDRIHNRKTGALISAAARCGAMIASADQTALLTINDYASKLGLLFQITDDLLDVTSTAEDLGKTPGKDVQARKATYPAIHGIEVTRSRIEEMRQAACDSLEQLSEPADLLKSIANLIAKRQG